MNHILKIPPVIESFIKMKIYTGAITSLYLWRL